MTIQSIPRPQLLAALAGEDICLPCRGRGSIVVDDPRSPRVCPMCEGRGVRGLPEWTRTVGRSEFKALRSIW